MKSTNYRDISTPSGDVGAGFQWEFVCESCAETWKSPFRPYRAGQAAGLFRRFGWVLNEFYRVGALSDLVFKVGRATGGGAEVGGSKPKAAALLEAQALAKDRYHVCNNCRTSVCDNCWVESSELCIKCEKATGSAVRASVESSASAMACPNCQTPSQGGRFCHECGFDMASTHKSCPGCGATMSRQARFCTDCGHGF